MNKRIRKKWAKNFAQSLYVVQSWDVFHYFHPLRALRLVRRSRRVNRHALAEEAGVGVAHDERHALDRT